MTDKVDRLNNQRSNTPPIGTKMFHADEHLYYVNGIAAPLKEYCVCEAEVMDYIKGGAVEIKLVGKDPGGYEALYYYRLGGIGTRIFRTVKEAALLAKRKTEQYERDWGALNPPDVPMRRTWEKYLEEAND
jgi:hypothetical protein